MVAEAVELPVAVTRSSGRSVAVDDNLESPCSYSCAAIILLSVAVSTVNHYCGEGAFCQGEIYDLIVAVVDERILSCQAK
jgi:hypothetical protein